MFERAWAHFRLTDMDGALAILMVHGSPFFEDWYFPEQDLLRVYALFLLCKFPDAQKEVDRFAERYKPIEAALQGPAAGYTPEKAWEEALLYRGGKKTEVPVMVLRRFGSDDRLAGAKAAVDKADEEIKRLQNVASSPFAAEAKARLEERRAALIRVEGARILAHIKRCQGQLHEMLANLDVTRLDVMQYETDLYERASVVGEVEFGDRIGQLRKLRKKPRTLVWPYEGEVWADELGYYQITARPDCPEKLQSGSAP
jgi:hypothetical protein